MGAKAASPQATEMKDSIWPLVGQPKKDCLKFQGAIFQGL